MKEVKDPRFKKPQIDLPAWKKINEFINKLSKAKLLMSRLLRELANPQSFQWPQLWLRENAVELYVLK